MLLSTKNPRRGRDVYWLLTAWLLNLALQGFILGGVRLGSDSHRYQEAARWLIKGYALEGKEGFFLGYNMLLSLIYRLGGGEATLVGAQWVAALAAALLMWLAADKAWGRPTGLGVGLAFLLWPDLMRWNWYILTDGLYTSLMGSCLALAWLSRDQPRWWLALVPALAWLCFLRPEGGLFLLPVAIYCALGRRWGTALALGLAWALLILWGGMQEMAEQESVLKHFRQGTFIWGQAPLSGGPDWPLDDSLARFMLRAFIADPGWTLGLLGRRWFWFMSHGRAYYSLPHNLWAFGSSILLWLLAGVAWFRQSSAWRDLALPSLALGLQFCLVGLTWSDYDGRDLTRLVPALLLLAGAALARPRRERDLLY